MTKEDMLEEAKWLVETNESAKSWFDYVINSKQTDDIELTMCFDRLYDGFVGSGNHIIGFWYGRIVNPNRPKG